MMNRFRQWGFPPVAVWLGILGVVQWLVAPIRPGPEHFFFTPLGLWALLDPLLTLRSPMPPSAQGSPHWTRRLLTWTGREAHRAWKPLVMLGIVTVLPYLPTLWRVSLLNVLHLAWVVLVPVCLAHWAINLGFVFLILSYGLPRASTVIPLLALGFAGRWGVEESILGRQAWQEVEIQWILAEAIGLVWMATVIDWRARRRLPLLGLRGVLNDLTVIPRIVQDSLDGPLGRISRPNWHSWWIPPACTLGLAVYLVAGRPRQPGLVAVAGTGFVCIVALAIFIREASRSLGGLRESGFLSALLLTLIRPSEVVAARSFQCLRPLWGCLVFQLLALVTVHAAWLPLWESSARFLYVHLAAIGGTLAVAILILGPYLNQSLRSRNGLEALLKTTARLVGLGIVVVVLIVFLAIQNAFGFSSHVLFLVPCTLLFLWILNHWQSLLKDFEDLAHGRPGPC